MEDEGQTLRRGERVEDDEQGHADRVGEECLLLGVAAPTVAGHRLSRLDVERLLAAGPARAQHVEGDPADDRGEPGGKVVDLVSVGPAEAQPRLLDRVVRLRRRSEDAVGDATHAAAVLLESSRQPCRVVSLVSHLIPFSRSGVTRVDPLETVDVTGDVTPT